MVADFTGRVREALVRQVAENSARLASATVDVPTTGWGEFSPALCLDFFTTFIHEPTVSYGYSVDGDTLVDGRYPRAWGFVRQWRQDPKGLYNGAWVGIAVDTLSSEFTEGGTPPTYDLIHKFM